METHALMIGLLPGFESTPRGLFKSCDWLECSAGRQALPSQPPEHRQDPCQVNLWGASTSPTSSTRVNRGCKATLDRSLISCSNQRWPARNVREGTRHCQMPLCPSLLLYSTLRHSIHHHLHHHHHHHHHQHPIPSR
ncbi:hypothetical protein BO99DRAFT_37118 [Aspergillus violaceofuscus CBS 115571]|uniref:Uncharacterized protein n=1 Tax=Aspergillus violaceofuscus (strain CBS 115571) TaxID=1450538 RepID=A0A2V5GXQ8_ASPV1|nr:hypothetical protein BO99DRAFT_37118 [Aspergillus violaceofuscus CBS 115571]